MLRGLSMRLSCSPGKITHSILDLSGLLLKSLKSAIINCPTLLPLDCASSSPVICLVDTLHIEVGYFLVQMHANLPKQHRYARFGSITLNVLEL